MSCFYLLPMADVFTPEKRSEGMSRIRGRDTKPELALRSILHRLGYRFTVNGPKNKSLPGRPDIVLPPFPFKNQNSTIVIRQSFSLCRASHALPTLNARR